jgi:dTMP kinase
VPERGRLIAFEGVEGAGKSTQLGLVSTALRAQGYSVVETREPGGTALGAEMRRLLMHVHDNPPAPLAELLLYLADRAQHVAEVIRPALAQGRIVLTDRFSASTIAYQGYARGLDLQTVCQLDAIARQGVAPDLVILLDCPAPSGLHRARGDDRFHREAVDFHERVRAGFLSIARQDPDRFCVIDATAAQEEVGARILEAVRPCLAPH